VQQSTNQWQNYPEIMGEAMELHNRILRENIKVTGIFQLELLFQLGIST
jgi:hypothetical protein